MAGDTVITVVGNLVDDPELRFTSSGAAVAKFRIASTPRFLDKQTGEWKDGDALFLTCNVWRQAAEAVSAPPVDRPTAAVSRATIRGPRRPRRHRGRPTHPAASRTTKSPHSDKRS